MKIYILVSYADAVLYGQKFRVHSVYERYDLAKRAEWHLVRKQIKRIRNHPLDQSITHVTYQVIERTLRTNLKGII